MYRMKVFLIEYLVFVHLASFVAKGEDNNKKNVSMPNKFAEQ